MVLNPDFKEFVRSLNNNRVRYLVIVGYAVAFHGHPRYTKDIDIWIDCANENAVRMIAALDEFGFGELGLTDSDFLEAGQIVQLGYRAKEIRMDTSGLDHINLTVSDLERSRQFYADLLGFELDQIPLDYANPFAAGSYYFMVGNVEIVLVTHPSTSSVDRFNETRPGLDHLSFKAPNEAALDALVKTLDEAGVENSGMQVYAPNGKRYVVFRDPDNIQLEYWLDTES